MHRYPGPRSFTGDDRHLFFGRDAEKQELFRLIVLNDLVVLFGESGCGKTSLLQAGVCPDLEAQQYKPVFLRLNSTDEAPERQVCRQLREGGYLPADMPEDRTMWEYFSRFWYVDLGEVYKPVIVFDQFEELFTLYRPEQRAAFIEQFAAIANRRPPAGLSPEAATPPQAKFVFSLRSDFLYLLDELSADIPSILRCRFQLRLLDRNGASDAIIRPAVMPGEYASPVFGYSPAALEGILDALAANVGGVLNPADVKTTEIAAFQLQLVCQHLEEKIIHEKRQKGFQIEPDFYGGSEGIRQIIEDFYNQVIEKVAPAEREAVEKLLARGLIRNGRRIMMEASAMRDEYGVSQAALELLHDERLLKREARKGELYYEISHDTLVKPVLERFKKIEEAERAAEAERLRRQAAEAEKKAREEAVRRAEAERLQLAAEKAKRRANVFALGAVGLALLAGIAFFIANRQSKIAKEQRVLADAAKISAETNANEALLQKQLAEANADSALLQKMRAGASEIVALSKEKEARRALEKMERANDNLVEQAVAEAGADMLALRYDAALSKLRNAAALERKKTQVANSLLEIAYFFNESGRRTEAQKELSTAAALLGTSANLSKGDRAALRSAMQNLSQARFAELEARYYPVLISVKGRSDLPGFKLAKTETTVWQYNLFLSAQGKNILNETTIKRPGWGWEGDNPMIFVSWYDAVEYANWLSEQRGLTPVYAIDREQKDTNNISDIDKLKWTVTLRENANGYRLPTKAEWEYAARGGPNQASFEYAGSDQPDGVAWHKGNSGNRAQPVGNKQPNGAGLHDLSGNVWEWCWDWDTASYGRYRAVRGGSWKNIASTIRISDGGIRSPDSRDDQYGFRLAQ